VLIPAAVTWAAWTHRRSVATAFGLVRGAALEWMAPAAVAIGGVYLCRALVYRQPLVTLGYRVPAGFLWRTALIATSLHQLIPAAGLSGYAFLTWALHQRGVSSGQASLIALVDTLSYAGAVAVLVIGTLLYLLSVGTLHSRTLLVGVAPGVAVVVSAGYVYWLQRDQGRLLHAIDRVAAMSRRRLGLRWPLGPVRAFLREYYEGKRLIRGRRGMFSRMLGFQFLAVACDACALYMTCRALDVTPPVWTVLMAFVVAMTGLAITGVPAGGGSFEAIMGAFFAAHGFSPAQGIAAAVLYRIVAFWIPVALSLVFLLRLRQRRREIRRVRPPRARGETPL
jgi:uncharacterized protein (TIRG00374 family)